MQGLKQSKETNENNIKYPEFYHSVPSQKTGIVFLDKALAATTLLVLLYSLHLPLSFLNFSHTFSFPNPKEPKLPL